MTIKELAKLTGFTPAYISLIERNLRDPSINTLFKIAKSLDVSTESLWTHMNLDSATQSNGKYILMPKSIREPAKLLNPGVKYESITINSFEVDRSIGLIGHIGKLLPKSSTNPDRPAVHNEDELTYILSGIMDCDFAGEIFSFSEGDAFIIKSGTEHNFINNSDNLTSFLTVRYAQ